MICYIVLYFYSGAIIVVRQNLCNISLSIPTHPPPTNPPGPTRAPWVVTFYLISLHSILRHYHFFTFNQETLSFLYNVKFIVNQGTLSFLYIQSRDIIISLQLIKIHYYFFTFNIETLSYLYI